MVEIMSNGNELAVAPVNEEQARQIVQNQPKLQQTIPQQIQSTPTITQVPSAPRATINEGPGATSAYYDESIKAGGNFYDAVHQTMPTLKALGGIPERERG